MRTVKYVVLELFSNILDKLLAQYSNEVLVIAIYVTCDNTTDC
jgi:hypothetical protein